MDSTPKLAERLGLIDGTTLVIGSMIGSGIFIVSADIARQVESPGLLIMTWVATAVLTLIAALSYGELAAMMPQAGGQYVYLRESLGPLWGFLYGWTLFTVIQTGTIAAVAVAFAKFSGLLFPWISTSNSYFAIGNFGLDSQRLVAILLIVFLTWVNSRGVRSGAIVQNIFTVAKTAGLAGLIVAGFFAVRNPAATANFDNFWTGASWSFDAVRLVGVAMVGALFSSDAWNNVTFTAGEMKNPKRNLPLALALGVLAVSTLYIAANFVYLYVLPLSAIQSAPQDRVATLVANEVFGGAGGTWMAIAIMISTFGCVNGLTLAGARVYYAMSLDGLFFKKVAEIDPVSRVPKISLWVQCLWACCLTLTGRYGDLLDYVIFAALLFYLLTIAGLFVLRRTRPDAPRPYRAIGYPVLPALYIVATSTIEILLLFYKPNYTWPGLALVALGVPVYIFWRKQGVQK